MTDKEGYTFTGWSLGFNNVTSNLLISTQYAINTYVVEFVDYDGTVLFKETVEHGNDATYKEEPTRENHNFVGWDTDFTNVTEDLKIMAKWEAWKPVSAIDITALVIGKPYDGQPLPNFEGVYVELKTETVGAEIYYTLDGSEPTKAKGKKYTEGFAIDTDNPFGETITLKAVAIKEGFLNSELATLKVIISAKDPVESFYYEDEFVGWYKPNETRPTFETVQGQDFYISSITGSLEEGYEIKLAGSIKIFVDTDSKFGHGGNVALLTLKYNIPEVFANEQGETELGLTWTSPIQSKGSFDTNANAWKKVSTGNYDSLTLSSNVFALKDESKLKFAINWNGVQNTADGYVEYTLDISNVDFVVADGNVLNDTQNTVHTTISDAVNNAVDGDTIIVGSGSYTEDVVINKSLTLFGSDATIVGTVTINQVDDVVFDGFTVNSSSTSHPAIHLIGTNNIQITNNVVISNSHYASIGTQTGPANVTGVISGNTVEGMIILGTDGALTVTNNDVTRKVLAAEAITFYPLSAGADITVVDNTFNAGLIGAYDIKFQPLKAGIKPDNIKINRETKDIDILSVVSDDNNSAHVNLSWFVVGTFGKTAYFGTPDNVFYYFEF